MKKYLAELIATFALVFCGTGAIVIQQESGLVTHVGVAITFGFIVMAMIYSFADLSGAHMNPAVSIALAVAKRFDWKQVAPYAVSQALGAFSASFLLSFLFPESQFLGSTVPAGSALQSLILEIVLTFILMLVVLRVSESELNGKYIAGAVIGGVVLLEAMFAGPISGASMNPIRSIAPAVVSMQLNHLWIYIIAPITGAILAVLVNFAFSNSGK